MSGEDAALFDAIAGDLLEELGYVRSERPGARTYVRAAGGWLDTQARRVVRKARKHSPTMP